jgi:hypothetical protein
MTETSITPRDRIPRVNHIIDHPADQLVGMAAGANTFDDCRVRYGDTAQRLSAEGRGRVTASRIPESDRFFGSTRDLLQELIRWKAIVPTPVPSARSALDAHRDRRYELTEEGHRLAEIAKASRSEFTNAVADQLFVAHPYFRGLLQALDRAPIVCPVPAEGDVARGRGGVAGWAGWAAQLIGNGVSRETVERTIAEHLDRRFASRAENDPPSNKDIAETLSDAFAVASFAAHGIEADGPTIKSLRRWGSELLLFDQSRYVPAYPSANVIWAAFDFQDGEEGPRPRRRGRDAHGEEVARALIKAYVEQQGASPTMTRPVHRVRAQAAFEARVMRALADMVLVDMIDGRYESLGIRALAFIGSSDLPDSEPAFRHRDRIRLEIQMVPSGTDTNTKEN